MFRYGVKFPVPYNAVVEDVLRHLREICREHFYFVGWFHGSALHGDRRTAGHEAHTNFPDESACLAADNNRNEVATIHRSQEVLKMLSLYK
jgi:predicted NAD/FAD-binding protein